MRAKSPSKAAVPDFSARRLCTLIGVRRTISSLGRTNTHCIESLDVSIDVNVIRFCGFAAVL